LKAYCGVIAILITSLALFATLSQFTEGVDIGSTHWNTATFVETLTKAPEQPHFILPENGFLAQLTKRKKVVRHTKTSGVKQDGLQKKPASSARGQSHEPMDTTAKTILFIGDSMLEGLGPRMAAYAKHNGHKLINVIWYSSTTEVWGSTNRLGELVAAHHPNYIFVCLGANELFVKDIKRKRQKFLDNMLSQIGDIPYVWIGPPNWKDDTGINEMLQSSCEPGCFYLSYTKDQHYDRSKDGAHPTRSSAARWCDRVCAWTMKYAAHPIRLNNPGALKAKARTIIYQPQR